MMGCRFSQARLARLAEIEGRHFWFVGRRALLERLIRRHLPITSGPILDIGCGTGSGSGYLRRSGYAVIGLDRRPEGLAHARERFGLTRPLQADAMNLPFRSGSIGAVTLLDVLEHLDDGAALGEIRRVLRPGGVALITVPAMPFLWSYRDTAAGHLRRYTRRRLTRTLARAGFEVRAVRYYQALLFPALAVARLVGRRGPRVRDLEEAPGRLANTILRWINLLDVRLGEHIPWPWGTSLVVVCTRA